MSETQRVTILGGGPSGMTTAYYLSDPSLNGKYEVTVYQYGWRLGGKGACSRDPKHGQRIQEHGLHQFLGFYDNAFRMIRELWPQWQRAPQTPFPTWDKAFTKQPQITFMQKCEDGWQPWNLKPPHELGTPGDPNPTKLEDLLGHLFDFIAEKHVEAGVHRRAPIAHLAMHLLRFLARIRHPFKRGHLFRGLISSILKWVYDRVVPHTLREDIDRIGLLIRIAFAAAEGFVDDVLPYGLAGFDRINDVEFRQWLMKHKLSHDDAWSAPIKSLYDAAFAYKTGDATKPEQNAQLAAGVAVHAGLLMLFGSRGAFLWKMNAGMGDTIFSPLYEVLRDRGVKFEFFHRVENLGLSADGKTIDRIEITKQVDLAKEYQPFVDVNGLPCWPDAPNWDCIVDGTVIARELDELGVDLESWWCTKSWAKQPNVVLQRGQHFDLVVCAMSLAALKPTTKELAAANPRWQAMLDNIPTIRTQAVQYWLAPTLEQLGWKHGPTVAVSYTEPFDSWGEMSHLLPAEDWGNQKAPSSCEYFCGAMPEDPADAPRSDTGFPQRMTELGRANAKKWIAANIKPLWPNVTDADYLSEFVRVNIDPSERYVLSTPGSMQYRLQTHESGFSNLHLAGDWIVTRVNSGAFEAAVESGCRCTNAICGVPAKVFGMNDY